MPMTPTTFSIILSAESRSSVCCARRERAEVRRIDEAALVDGANALFDGELVELGNAPLVAAHRCHPARVVCHLKAVVGQRDVDHSKTPIRYRFPECVEPFRVGRAREPEIAPAGAADLVRDAMAARFGADLAMLGRDEVHADRFPELLQAAPIGRKRVEPSRGVRPLERRATGLCQCRQTADQLRRFPRSVPAPSPIVRNQIGRRSGPAGKNTRESYTVREAD